MRAIVLKGHERAINYIKYNREGDLLFSCSKANNICVWYAHSGERLGTYEGHSGAVWFLDVSRESTSMLTASADMSVKLWDVSTGKNLFTFPCAAPARCVGFCHGDENVALAATDAKMGQKPLLHLYKLAADLADQEAKPYASLLAASPINRAYWGASNEHIFTCHEDGNICLWDVEKQAIVSQTRDTDAANGHTANVKQLDFAPDYVTFLSSSADTTAKLWDTRDLRVIKTYNTNRPVNSAALSPSHDLIVLGGGQEARDVTTTGMRAGKFDSIFFHKVFEEELGSVKGHFGPIHTLQFSPDGKQFSSGSEDGFVRIHNFDDTYFRQAAKFAS